MVLKLLAARSWPAVLLTMATIFWSNRHAEALPPPTVTLVGTSEVTPQARYYESLNSTPHSTEDLLRYYDGYVFVTYYDQDNRLCLFRANVLSGTSKTLVFSETVTGEDGHNTPNVGISSYDGRIHLAYGHHNVPLRYKISDDGIATAPDAQFTTAAFSAETDRLRHNQPLAKVTYPLFVSEENSGRFFMVWREAITGGGSGKGDTYWARYQNHGNWSVKRKIIDGFVGTWVDPTGTVPTSTNRNAYLNHLAMHGDELHLSWGWRESAQSYVGAPTDNHDLMFARSSNSGQTWNTTQSWQNTAGLTVGDPTTPMTLNSDVKVWDIPVTWNRANLGPSVVDSDGNTHVILAQAPSDAGGSRTYFHYVRQGTTWTRHQIGFSGGNYDMVVDRRSNTLYLAGTSANRVRIWAAQKNADTGETNWEKWTMVYQTPANIYSSKPILELVNDGDYLLMVSQRRSDGSGSSPMELFALALDNQLP